MSANRSSPMRGSPLRHPGVSPIANRSMSEFSKTGDFPSHSAKQLEFLNRQTEEEKEEMSRLLQMKEAEMGEYWEELEGMREELQGQIQKNEELEKSHSELVEKKKLEEQQKEQQQFQDQLKSTLLHSDQELKALQKSVEEKLGSVRAEPLAAETSKSPGQQWRKTYESRLANLQEQIAAEQSKREQESKETDPLKELKNLRERFDTERNLWKKKVNIESDARSFLEQSFERLEDTKRDGRDTPKGRRSQRERERERDRDRDREWSDEEPSSRALQDQLDEMRVTFRLQLREAQERLEREFEAAKETQLRDFEHEIRILEDEKFHLEQQMALEAHRREEMETRMNSLHKRLEEEADQGSVFQKELKTQLQTADKKLEEQMKEKYELQEKVWKLNRELEEAKKKSSSTSETQRFLESELEAMNRKLKVEMVSVAELGKKYSESLRQWKAIFEIFKNTEAKNFLTPEERETIDAMAQAYANRQYVQSNSQAEEFVKKMEEEMMSLREGFENERRKREFAEASKEELMKRFESFQENGGEASETIAQLFEAKRDAEEKLDELKRKLKTETKQSNEREETSRKLQLRLEKAKRDLEAERKNALTMRKRLEDELKEWKGSLERELDSALRRLEEEDAARQEIIMERDTLQEDLNEARRQLKGIQLDLKTKLTVESEERRNYEDANRRLLNELEDTRRALQAEEKARSDMSKQHEDEIKEWKKMVEQRLAESIQRAAEEELKRNELEESFFKVQTELDKVRKEWNDESEELRRRLNDETKAKMSAENSKRDLHGQMEEVKKNLRGESNHLSEAKESNRMLRVELENAKRSLERFQGMKDELESKKMKIEELHQQLRTSAQAHQEELAKQEKKQEILRVKIEMEAKMKTDMGELKRRLEKELDEAEKVVEEEIAKRKVFEEENWRLHMELNESKRKAEELAEEYSKKSEAEALLRSVLQESNEKLHGDLENTRYSEDKRSRSQMELEEANRKLHSQVEALKQTFEEKVEQMSQALQSERNRRVEAEESVEHIQQEYALLKDSLEEAKARYSLEASKRQFERELEVKKRTFEKQLEGTRRSSLLNSRMDDSEFFDGTSQRSNSSKERSREEENEKQEEKVIEATLSPESEDDHKNLMFSKTREELEKIQKENRSLTPTSSPAPKHSHTSPISSSTSPKRQSPSRNYESASPPFSRTSPSVPKKSYTPKSILKSPLRVEHLQREIREDLQSSLDQLEWVEDHRFTPKKHVEFSHRDSPSSPSHRSQESGRLKATSMPLGSARGEKRLQRSLEGLRKKLLLEKKRRDSKDRLSSSTPYPTPSPAYSSPSSIEKSKVQLERELAESRRRIEEMRNARKYS